MFDAVTLNGGSSHDSPLERSRSKIGAPRSPFGVWQFWQVMIVLTRYLPRSTGVCADAEPHAASNAAITNPVRMRILNPPMDSRSDLPRRYYADAIAPPHL